MQVLIGQRVSGGKEELPREAREHSILGISRRKDAGKGEGTEWVFRAYLEDDQ
jgi:hypothetical protein